MTTRRRRALRRCARRLVTRPPRLSGRSNAPGQRSRRQGGPPARRGSRRPRYPERTVATPSAAARTRRPRPARSMDDVERHRGEAPAQPGGTPAVGTAVTTLPPPRCLSRRPGPQAPLQRSPTADHTGRRRHQTQPRGARPGRYRRPAVPGAVRCGTDTAGCPGKAPVMSMPGTRTPAGHEEPLR